MSERIQLSEWDDVVDELRRFGDAGDVTVDDDGIRLDFGSAHVDISRDGAVSTGMPLHSFEFGGDVTLVVDHGAGSLTVEAEQLRYTFRRPGAR
jgi:hypothetical protein